MVCGQKKIFSLYKKAHTPLEWHKPLYKYAKKKILKFLVLHFQLRVLSF